jgi:hypothetical protein
VSSDSNPHRLMARRDRDCNVLGRGVDETSNRGEFLSRRSGACWTLASCQPPFDCPEFGGDRVRLAFMSSRLGFAAHRSSAVVFAGIDLGAGHAFPERPRMDHEMRSRTELLRKLQTPLDVWCGRKADPRGRPAVPRIRWIPSVLRRRCGRLCRSPSVT